MRIKEYQANKPISALNRVLTIGSLCMLVGCLFIACEVTLDPIEPDPTEPFSVFGSLNPKSSRQWIRVTPIRDTLFNAHPEIDATVTLFDEVSNQVAELQDSVSFRRIDDDETVYFINYWTDYPILPERTYIFRAQNSDGYTSSATVSIPANYQLPIIESVIQDATISRGTLKGDGIERVVILDVAYDLFVIKDEIEFSEKVVVSQLYQNTFHRFDDGTFDAIIDDMAFLRSAFNIDPTRGDFIRIDSAKIYMAAGNDSWPDTESYTLEELTIPHFESNIENGVGVLVGINTVVFPFQSCKEDDEFVPCEQVNIPFETIFEYRRLQEERLNQ